MYSSACKRALISTVYVVRRDRKPFAESLLARYPNTKMASKRNITTWLTPFAVLLLLAGCGGQGDDSPGGALPAEIGINDSLTSSGQALPTDEVPFPAEIERTDLLTFAQGAVFIE